MTDNDKKWEPSTADLSKLPSAEVGIRIQEIIAQFEVSGADWVTVGRQPFLEMIRFIGLLEGRLATYEHHELNNNT